MITLRPRLELVLELAGTGRLAADIGADHGRLSCALLQRGRFEQVIATDVSGSSLEKARALKEKCMAEGNLILRVGDGLAPLAPDCPEVILLCGMGGELIAAILQRSLELAQNARRLVLQPMGGAGCLREYLVTHGFCIVQDRLVRDAGRTYQVITAQPGREGPRPEGWPLGLYDPGWVCYREHDPLLQPMLERMLAIRGRALKNAPESAQELREETKRLMALKQRLEGTCN